ncbi:hypothetical protein CEXT_400471 [Caerostris extrusa]|uniref:Uncharacterized protein n=1 Tax=Caerostris extrusa TaxID=172846 RepID=A0AAV4Q737_CAEEX|nr:hypothetical protein CEXT_400471 [Caerostris extrusa]
MDLKRWMSLKIVYSKGKVQGAPVNFGDLSSVHLYANFLSEKKDFTVLLADSYRKDEAPLGSTITVTVNNGKIRAEHNEPDIPFLVVMRVVLGFFSAVTHI